MSNKKEHSIDTRIISVTTKECECNEIYVTIIFKPSSDIKYQLIKWIEGVEFPVEMIEDGLYKYSEYLTYGKEVERFLNLLNMDKINSSYFIRVLKDLDKYWN